MGSGGGLAVGEGGKVELPDVASCLSLIFLVLFSGSEATDDVLSTVFSNGSFPMCQL